MRFLNCTKKYIVNTESKLISSVFICNCRKNLDSCLQHISKTSFDFNKKNKNPCVESIPRFKKMEFRLRKYNLSISFNANV